MGMRMNDAAMLPRTLGPPVAGPVTPLKACGSNRVASSRRRRPGGTILMASIQTTGFSMKSFRLLTAIAFLAAAPWPALAAEATFPQGVRVGLTPLVGLAPAKSFPGFESEDQSIKVLVTELPADAYGEVKSAFTANPGG